LEYPSVRMSEAPFPVEYAVLGLLAQGPKHGYELKREIERKLRPIWRIATSRLYLALSRLEHSGLIQGEPQVTKGRARRVYRLTPEGERRLWEWLRRPVPALRDLRVEFLAKLYFLLKLDPHGIPPLIEAEIDALKNLAREIRRQEPPQEDPSMWKCVRDFRLGQIEAALKWLRRTGKEFSREVRG